MKQIILILGLVLLPMLSSAHKPSDSYLTLEWHLIKPKAFCHALVF